MEKNINLISLKCSNCSANLELSDKLNRFICNYCGTEQLLVHGTDGYSFQRLEQKLENIEKVAEKSAAELALKRLREDLQLKMVQINAIIEDKGTKIRGVEEERELSIKTIIGAAFFQLVILKFDMNFTTYLGFQGAILLVLLYQLHYLGVLQQQKKKILEQFQPELTQVADEIKALELKIKNKIKIVDK